MPSRRERDMQINLLSYMHRAYNLWWQIKRCWGCRITRTHTNGHTLYLMHTRAYSQTSSRKQKMINWIKCNSHWPCFALRLRMQFVALYDCHLIPDSTATYCTIARRARLTATKTRRKKRIEYNNNNNNKNRFIICIARRNNKQTKKKNHTKFELVINLQW